MKLFREIWICALSLGLLPCFNAAPHDASASSNTIDNMVDELSASEIIAAFIEKFANVVPDIVLPLMSGSHIDADFLRAPRSALPIPAVARNKRESRSLAATQDENILKIEDPRQTIIDITRDVGSQYGVGGLDAAAARAFIDGLLAPLGIVEDFAALALTSKRDGIHHTGVIFKDFAELGINSKPDKKSHPETIVEDFAALAKNSTRDAKVHAVQIAEQFAALTINAKKDPKNNPGAGATPFHTLLGQVASST